MSRFQPKNPDYRAIAIHTFEQQRAMAEMLTQVKLDVAALNPKNARSA